ncbi:MAG: tetratricopeptide repeat protein [Deltaproteobacteria bacterium]|nr:tetratricopeptide repeat protein [Deltaproteobacteria bacterium]
MANELDAKLKAWAKGSSSLASAVGVTEKDMKGLAAVAAKHHEAENDGAAIKIYEGLAALGFDLGEHQARLASAYQRSNRPEDAIRCYVAALAKAPNDLYVLANLAELLMNRGRMQEAADLLKKAIELDPKNAHPAGKRARALAVKGAKITGKK